MRSFLIKLGMRTVLVVMILTVAISAAHSQTFDKLLRGFRQRKSPSCVMYAHVLAVAENDPAAFTKNIRKVDGGWMVDFFDNGRIHVTQKEVTTSITCTYSAGEPDNLLTVYMIALTKRCGGYSPENGKLDYGTTDFRNFLSKNTWSGYGEESGPDHTLADGLARVAKETGSDGKIRIPSTIGFGLLNEKTVPKYVKQVQKFKLVGGHDFEIIGYNHEKQIVRMRNPWKPREIVEAPVDLLLKIPCGIDFMEPEPSKEDKNTQVVVK